MRARRVAAEAVSLSLSLSVLLLVLLLLLLLLLFLTLKTAGAGEDERVVGVVEALTDHIGLSEAETIVEVSLALPLRVEAVAAHVDALYRQGLVRGPAC